MILKLLESQRVRRFARGALVASVAAHVGAGLASGPGDGRADGANEPLSVRYLVPPSRPAAERVERIAWASIGSAAGEARPVGKAPVRAAAARAAAPDVGDAEGPTTAEQVAQTFQDYEVDSAATRDPASGGPEYPAELRVQGVQGEVVVEFAVDTTGHADEATFAVVTASHPAFARAVREALPRMLFVPAVAHGARVRQLVRLPMKFKLVTETAAVGTL